MERFHPHACSVRGMCDDIAAIGTVKVVSVPVKKMKLYLNSVYRIQTVSFTVKLNTVKNYFLTIFC